MAGGKTNALSKVYQYNYWLCSTAVELHKRDTIVLRIDPFGHATPHSSLLHLHFLHLHLLHLHLNLSLRFLIFLFFLQHLLKNVQTHKLMKREVNTVCKKKHPVEVGAQVVCPCCTFKAVILESPQVELATMIVHPSLEGFGSFLCHLMRF